WTSRAVHVPHRPHCVSSKNRFTQMPLSFFFGDGEYPIAKSYVNLGWTLSSMRYRSPSYCGLRKLRAKSCRLHLGSQGDDETPNANLSLGMRQLNGIYTQSFNRRRNRVGHLF